MLLVSPSSNAQLWLIFSSTLALGSEILIAFLPQSSRLIRRDVYLYLLSCLFAMAAYIVYRSINEQKHPSPSPAVPVVPTWLPWLGHAISYNYNNPYFIRNCRARYGSAFKFLAAGRHIVAISHPTAVHKFLQDRSDTFVIIEFQFLDRLGGFKDLKRLADIYTLGPNKAILSLRSPLAPRNLKSVTTVYNVKLFELLESLINPSETRTMTTSIKNLVDRNFFSGIVLSLMGENFARDWKFEEYEAFDQGVLDILRGIHLPYGKGKRARAARERQVIVMLKFLEKHFREGYIEDAEDSPGSLAIRILKEGGANEEEVSRMQIAFMWGAVSNIMHACKWVFYYLLADPDVLQKIQNEVQESISDKFGSNITLLLHSDPQSFGSRRDAFPLLNSAIQETFRITALPSSGRVATRDVDIRIDESTVIPIKKGEIVLADALSMHRSAENFQESDTFKVDRFMVNDANSNIRNVYIPFGIGPHKCPGQHYALHAIKMFFVLCLHFYDISPESDNSIPEVDPTSFLAVARAKEDRRVILKRRALP